METMELTASDGHRLSSVLAMPGGDKPRGGVVVVQDAFGVGDYIAGVCARFAGEGYAALAPALYDRQQRGARFGKSPEEMAAATRLRNNLDWNGVLADVEAARLHLAQYGKVGIVGYCAGGSVVWLAAQELTFDAASSYYGKDVPDWLDAPPQCPLILHFGERDHLIPMDRVAEVRKVFPDIPVYTYDAGHAFDNPDTGFDPAHAARAQQRTLALFREHVG